MGRWQIPASHNWMGSCKVLQQHPEACCSHVAHTAHHFSAGCKDEGVDVALDDIGWQVGAGKEEGEASRAGVWPGGSVAACPEQGPAVLHGCNSGKADKPPDGGVDVWWCWWRPQQPDGGLADARCTGWQPQSCVELFAHGVSHRAVPEGVGAGAGVGGILVAWAAPWLVVAGRYGIQGQAPQWLLDGVGTRQVPCMAKGRLELPNLLAHVCMAGSPKGQAAEGCMARQAVHHHSASQQGGEGAHRWQWLQHGDRLGSTSPGRPWDCWCWASPDQG